MRIFLFLLLLGLGAFIYLAGSPAIQEHEAQQGKRHIEQMIADARAIPASNHQANIDAYSDLAGIQPVCQVSKLRHHCVAVDASRTIIILSR